MYNTEYISSNLHCYALLTYCTTSISQLSLLPSQTRLPLESEKQNKYCLKKTVAFTPNGVLE